jgi:CrcB protein
VIWFLVFVGGGLGSAARHGVNRLIHQRTLAATFPFGIFAINVIGSTLIGVVGGLLTSSRLHLSYEARTFLIVGFFGGFTTFSSFTLDTLALIRDGHTAQAIANVVGQVGLGLIMVAVGYRVASLP